MSDLVTRRPSVGDPRLPERFWSKVQTDDSGCWLWTASLTNGGYGQYYPAKNEPRRAHRIAYEVLVGPIPVGLVIDHLCRIRRCCNPAHLEPVTHRENTLRGESFVAAYSTTTHCPQGHPYSGTNLRIRPSGRRSCRECERIRVRAQRASHKESSNV